MTGINQFENFSRASVVLGNAASSKISGKSTRLTGDIASDFSKMYQSELDKTARPSGFAANSAKASANGEKKTIDKTSELYEKSLESMRKTVTKSGGENSFAQKMYEDMLYNEYTAALTKNAGFGIADSIYLELSR